jgi:hypothetical protein
MIAKTGPGLIGNWLQLAVYQRFQNSLAQKAGNAYLSLRSVEA